MNLKGKHKSMKGEPTNFVKGLIEDELNQMVNSIVYIKDNNPSTIKKSQKRKIK